MCIISKQSIAFCAQVEGMRGEILAVSLIALQSRIMCKERIAFCVQLQGTQGEIFTVLPIALQSRCKRVTNEPIQTYGHSWPPPQSVRLKQETDRARRKGETAIGGQYAM
jgi:hypothetical protein